MKKILGFVFQVTALVTLGYMFLNNSLLLVADWLSPILSGQVYSFVTLLYLVAADPFKYPDVSAIWAFSSVIAGVFIRKRVGSVLSVLLTWFLIVSLSAVLVFGMVMEAQENIVLDEGMDPFEVMPPFPDGLTISTISEAPILGEIYRFATNLINEQLKELEPSTVLNHFAGLFTFSIISKPLISAVFSLLGVELGKRLEHLFEPTIFEKRLILKKRLVSNGKKIILLLVLFNVFTTPIQAKSTDLYTENLVAFINEQGQVIVSGFFASSNLEGLDLMKFKTDGFIGCIIVSHQDILAHAYEYVDTPEEADFSEMLNLLPETLVAFLYIDVEPDDAQTHSDMVALELSTFYKMEISKLLPFSQNVENEGFTHTITVNIYQSPLTLEEFNSMYLQQYQEYGGYIESINNNQLIPGKIPDSVDGSLLFTGYLDTATILDLVPLDTSMIPIVETRFVGLAGFIGYWDSSVTILADSLSIEDVFNSEDELEISGDSDFSSSVIIAPGIMDDTKTLKMSTSIPVPNKFQEIIEEELAKLGIQADIGGHESTKALQISLDGIPLPLDLRVTRDISYIADKVNVKITIQNNDAIAAQQVVVDDTASFCKYQNVASNGNFVQRIQTICPGETIVFEYEVTVDNPGTYTLKPALISYMNRDRSYDSESEDISFNVERPSMSENLGNTFRTLFDSEEALSQYLPANISSGIQVSKYAIIIYIIADNIRKLRSWILA